MVTARKIFPMLVWCAEHGRTVTYQQLRDEIERRDLGWSNIPRNYGSPAGRIGDALMGLDFYKTEIPLINVLIVNGVSGLPGSGCDDYIDQYTDHHEYAVLPIEEKKAVVGDIQDKVYAFEHWRDLLGWFGLKPLGGDMHLEESNELEVYQPSEPSQGDGGGESDEHKALKQYVADHPECVGLPVGAVPEIEKRLYSGDSVDVCFAHSNKLVGVEVKSYLSDDNDICRGIYQCVKYRHVLRAMQKAENKMPTARAILIVGRQISSSLRKLAELQHANVKVIELHCPAKND